MNDRESTSKKRNRRFLFAGANKHLSGTSRVKLDLNLYRVIVWGATIAPDKNLRRPRYARKMR